MLCYSLGPKGKFMMIDYYRYLGLLGGGLYPMEARSISVMQYTLGLFELCSLVLHLGPVAATCQLPIFCVRLMIGSVACTCCQYTRLYMLGAQPY